MGQRPPAGGGCACHRSSPLSDDGGFHRHAHSLPASAGAVVLDVRATPATSLRMERAKTLSEELFLLRMMGNDRAVAQGQLH
ncbi:MAG: hypothetical protein ABJL72_01320 [Roseobacter sp.]